MDFQVLSRDVKTLSLLLQSPDTDVVLFVLEQIPKLDREKRRSLDFPYASLILNEKLKQSCVACLRAMADDISLDPMVLVRVLKDESVYIQDDALHTLAVSCKDYTSKNMVRLEFIKQIPQYIQSSDPDVRKSALYLVSILADDFLCRFDLKDYVLQVILMECSSDYNEIQELAIDVVSKFAMDKASQILLTKLQAPKKLLDLLYQQTTPPNAHSFLVRALCYFPIQIDIVKFLNREDLKLKRACCRYLQLNPTKDSSCISALCQGLAYPDPQISSCFAMALSLCENESDLLKFQAVDVIMQRIMEPEFREAALCCLAHFLQFPKLKQKLHSTNLMTECLKELEQKHKQEALECLINMCKDEQWRMEVIRLNGTQLCFQLLSTVKVKYITSLCQLICRLLQEDEARIIAVSFVELIHEKLKTFFKPICNVVEMGCANSNFAQIFCSLGLELLNSTKTLERVLDSNPSCMYWYRNRIPKETLCLQLVYDVGSQHLNFPLLQNAKNAVVAGDDVNVKVNSLRSILRDQQPLDAKEEYLLVGKMVMDLMSESNFESKYRLAQLSLKGPVSILDITWDSLPHKAFLFKVLCDRLGLPCSLERGDYGICWNTCLGLLMDLKELKLIPEDSIEAKNYKRP